MGQNLKSDESVPKLKSLLFSEPFISKRISLNLNLLKCKLGTSSLNWSESSLLLKTEQERPLEKLQLFQRPFHTVPYLGRGSVDPGLESQLQQGEMATDKKSVSTVMEKSFAAYSLYPTDDKMENQVKDASHTVEEAAMDGWVRGGSATREMSADEFMKQNNRPSGMF